MLIQIRNVMTEASEIISLEWLISDDTNDTSANAVDPWFSENLQDE